MVNEIALVLLYGLFGWKVAAIYMSTGLGIAIIAVFSLKSNHSMTEPKPATQKITSN